MSDAEENSGTPTRDRSAAPDFDRLAARAFAADEETGAVILEDLDRLWAAFLSLEEWHYLVMPYPDREPYPFIDAVEGLAWLFLFTDFERLRRFADGNGFLDPDRNARFITMPVPESLEWLANLRELQVRNAGRPEASETECATPVVYGIRINEGPHGWYTSLESLPAIYGHLKELGLI
jgi:hypothetical protein